jgi:hypothetical protein
MQRNLHLLLAASVVSGAMFLAATEMRAADPPAADTSNTVKDSARDAKDSVRDAATDTKNAVKDAASDTARTASDIAANTGAAALKFPAGIATKDLGEDKDIRSELANLTEDAVGHNKFDNLIGNFVDQDRNRMKDVKDADVTALNEKIGDIRRSWKDKYGHEFDIDKANLVFNEQFSILQGEVTDTNQAMANWPVPATAQLTARPGDNQGAAVTAGATTGDNDKGDINLEKGRNVALVSVPASHGLPAMTVSLIHELPDQWRIDVPNNVTGTQFKDNLTKHLSHVQGMKAEWPSDENDAYRAVAHHVLMAIYNVDMSSATGASGTSGGTAPKAD